MDVDAGTRHGSSQDIQAVGIAVMAHRLGHDIEQPGQSGRTLADNLLRQCAGPVKARKLPLIYPTAGFAGLLFVLGAMWYAASSQNNTAVYLLLFALTAVFLVSIPHTLINLASVTVTAESVQPAFVGQEVSLPLEIMNYSRATRHGIELVLSGSGQRASTHRLRPSP